MATRQLSVDVLLTAEDLHAQLVDDGRRGLTSSPKAISPVWFYDDTGSTLFDEITRLPEYYLTRAERSLLEAHATTIAEIACADTLVELGSGTSDKTRLLLGAMDATDTLRRYVPLDVSEQTLRAAAAAIADEYPQIDVHAVVGDFHQHLSSLPSGRRRLFAFLGSTIGNLRPAQRRRFLRGLRDAMGSSDRVLIGFDLVKAPERLLAAYDDAAGVTARFNENALNVLNATLGASFEPGLFEHVALWDAHEQWIEMHLRARADHRVAVAALEIDLAFERGETLRTETSAKFTRARIEEELRLGGFVVDESWGSRGDFLLVLARLPS